MSNERINWEIFLKRSLEEQNGRYQSDRYGGDDEKIW